MSKTPTYDAKVKAILDALVPGERTCALTGETWIMNEEEIGWYKKFNVPPAIYSPLTRQKIYCSFWTGYQWWYNKNALTSKPVLSFYHPATGVKVLPDQEWFAQDYSSPVPEVDLKGSLFSGMRHLMRTIPFPAGSHLKEPENSIALLSGGDRNSYFMCGCDSEQSLFGWWSSRLVNACEIWSSNTVSDSYSISDSKNVHDSSYIRCCRNVISSAFCFLCDDIDRCFGTTNQKHKKYLWFNEQLSKEEYEARLKEVDLSTRAGMEKWVHRFRDLVGKQTVWPEHLSARAEQSTGEYNYDISNCTDCYSCVRHCTGLFRCQYGVEARDSAYSAPVYSSRCYESTTVFQSDLIRFSQGIYRCHDIEYGFLNYDCEHCFGCVGLHRKRFHIFNKPYSEKEYWETVDALKCQMLESGEYGRFFPLALSPTYFGESGAVKHYGASVGEWSGLGGKPFEAESEGAIGDLSKGNTRSSRDVPESIDDLRDEDWVGKPILDEEHQRKFAFLKPELDFYRRKRLAPPRTHFAHRMIDLLHESNLAVFEDRTCAKCGNGIRVAKNITYPNRIIYCMPCYLKYLEQRW